MQVVQSQDIHANTISNPLKLSELHHPFILNLLPIIICLSTFWGDLLCLVLVVANFLSSVWFGDYLMKLAIEIDLI